MSLHLPSEDELREIARSETTLQRAAMAREILRLREALAKDEAELAKPEPFSQCSDGWGYVISSIGWDDIKMPSRISICRTHQDGREELLSFVPERKREPEVKRLEGERVVIKPKGTIVGKDGMEIVGNVEVCGDYEPPADVLGEALRRSVLLATPGKGLPLGSRDGCLLGESVDAAKFRHLHAAVSKLAQVVERIARAQRGGK